MRYLLFWRFIFCALFGHRSINTYRWHHATGSSLNKPGSELTSWRCECCGAEQDFEID